MLCWAGSHFQIKKLMIPTLKVVSKLWCFCKQICTSLSPPPSTPHASWAISEEFWIKTPTSWWWLLNSGNVLKTTEGIVCFNWVNYILNFVSIKPGQNSFFAGNRKWSEVKVAQSCPILCDPMDYTVHEILKARILEWVAFPFSRGSSQPRDRTQVSCIAGGFFTNWAIREAPTPNSNRENRELIDQVIDKSYPRCPSMTRFWSQAITNPRNDCSVSQLSLFCGRLSLRKTFSTGGPWQFSYVYQFSDSRSISSKSSGTECLWLGLGHMTIQ